MPVAYRNTRTGRVVHLAEALPSMDRSKRWERIGDEVPETSGGEAGQAGGVASPPLPGPGEVPQADGPFDPAGHTVKQVNDYLAGADIGERDRVLQAEAEGRRRRGILSGPSSDLTGA